MIWRSIYSLLLVVGFLLAFHCFCATSLGWNDEGVGLYEFGLAGGEGGTETETGHTDGSHYYASHYYENHDDTSHEYAGEEHDTTGEVDDANHHDGDDEHDTTGELDDASHHDADDEHGSSEGHGSGEHELTGVFGSLHWITPMTGSLSIIIIIFAVYLVENLFHELHRYSDDTPFQDMIAGLEKELMIVGCMAFIFKVIISNNSFMSTEWLHALEYADTVVPFVSFCFCAQGLFLILVSIHYCSSWSKAYHLLPEELELDYFELVSGNKWSIWHYIKREQLRAELEFKIIHELFCVQWRIKRFSIPFDVYVERVFEKYLLETITIAPMDWFVICLLALANWGRKQFHIDYPEHLCDAEDVNCFEMHDLSIFTYAGCIMFAFTCVLAIQSRYYERKLLAGVGVSTLQEYIQYLAACDKQIHEPKRQKCFDVEDLKENIRKVRDVHQEEEEGSILVRYFVYMLVEMGRMALRGVIVLAIWISSLCGGHRDSSAKSIFDEDFLSSKFGRLSSGGSSRSVRRSFSSREEETRKRAEAQMQRANVNQPNFMTSFRASFRGPLIDTIEEASGKSGASADDNDKAPPPMMREISKKFQANSREQEYRARMQKSTSMTQFGDKEKPKVKSSPAATSSKVFPTQSAGDGRRSTLSSFVPSKLQSANSEHKPAAFLSDWKSGAAPGALTHGAKRGPQAIQQGPLTPQPHQMAPRQFSINSPSGENKDIEHADNNSDDEDNDRGFNRLESTHQPAARLADWKNGMAPGALASGSQAIRKQSLKTPTSQKMGESPKSSSKFVNSTKKIMLSMKMAKLAKQGSGISNRSTEDEALGKAIREAFLEKHEITMEHQSSLEESSNDLKASPTERISQMFLFGSPGLYFRFIMLQIMIVSFYLALWITNFLITSMRLTGTDQLWGLYSFLPGLGSAVLYFYIVKSSAVLKAMVYWDSESMNQVLEDAEASKKLGEEVRERMLQKLPNIADPLKELQILFSQISSEGSNSLKRKEFQMLLNSLDIHFSRKKWALIFKEVDHNFDDEISLEELFLFIFPDHDVAKKAEKKRMKIIATRVKNMNKIMVQHGLKTTTPDLASVSDDELKRKRRRTSIMSTSGKGIPPSGGGGAGSSSVRPAPTDLATVVSQLAALPTIEHVENENDSSDSDDGKKPGPIIVSARSISSFRGPLSSSRSGDSWDKEKEKDAHRFSSKDNSIAKEALKAPGSGGKFSNGHDAPFPTFSTPASPAKQQSPSSTPQHTSLAALVTKALASPQPGSAEDDKKGKEKANPVQAVGASAPAAAETQQQSNLSPASPATTPTPTDRAETFLLDMPNKPPQQSQAIAVLSQEIQTPAVSTVDSKLVETMSKSSTGTAEKAMDGPTMHDLSKVRSLDSILSSAHKRHEVVSQANDENDQSETDDFAFTVTGHNRSMFATTADSRNGGDQMEPLDGDVLSTVMKSSMRQMLEEYKSETTVTTEQMKAWMTSLEEKMQQQNAALLESIARRDRERSKERSSSRTHHHRHDKTSSSEKQGHGHGYGSHSKEHRKRREEQGAGAAQEGSEDPAVGGRTDADGRKIATHTPSNDFVLLEC